MESREKATQQLFPTKKVSDNLPKATQEKIDIENYFGFDDDCDSDEDFSLQQSLPAINASVVTAKTNTKEQSVKPASSSPIKKFTQKILSSVNKQIGFFKRTDNASVAGPSELFTDAKPQSKISTHFSNVRNKKSDNASKPSPSKKAGKKVTTSKTKIAPTSTQTVDVSESESSYIDNDALTLFETTWPTREDQKHRSYSRKQKHEHKRQYDKNIITDDESEAGDVPVQKRTKRTKQKDDNYEEELKKLAEKLNSDFEQVEQYEMHMEKST